MGTGHLKRAANIRSDTCCSLVCKIGDRQDWGQAKKLETIGALPVTGGATQ